MYKILIVDDEKLLRQGFLYMTNWPEHGYQIIGEAADGAEALRLIEGTEPEIVITDIRMPVMDGIELTRIIKQNFPHIQVIILSSYNDFDYVRETLKLGALDYILKPKMEFQDLLAVLEKAKSRIDEQNKPQLAKDTLPDQQLSVLRSSFFLNLLANEHFDRITLQDQLEKHEIPLNDENLQLLVYYFEKDILETGELFKEHILDLINTNFKLLFNQFSVFFNGLTLVTILNCLPEQATIVDTLCHQIIQQFNQSHQLNLWILATEEFSGIANIYEVFQQALKTSQLCFYKDKNQVLKTSDFFEITSFIETDFKALNSLIEKFDFKGIRELTNSIPTGMISREIYIEPYSLKKYFSEICYHIIYKLHELGFHSDQISKQKFSYFKRIEGSNSYLELIQSYDTIIHEIYAVVILLRNNNFNPTIQRIIEYIHLNYHQELSLHMAAKIFHMNKSYLCQLFKQQTGENFNDFLVHLRMEKAKELLRNSEHNVNTVCNLVGYSNPSYFGQVFKNVVGMTPSEYTKLFMK